MSVMDITIKDNAAGTYLVLPVLPETISYTVGETSAETVNVLSIGDVDFLRGKALDTFDLESFFPGVYDPSICVTRALKTPEQYRTIFNTWKASKTVLQLIIPAAGVNIPVTLRTFTHEPRGAQKDIYYTAGFKQHRTVAPRVIQLNATAPPAKKAATDRPKAQEQPKAKTYTVKAGDTLSQIAKKLGIKDWRKGLYEPNKAPKGPLGADPNRIQVGQVLKIP